MDSFEDPAILFGTLSHPVRLEILFPLPAPPAAALVYPAPLARLVLPI